MKAQSTPRARCPESPMTSSSSDSRSFSASIDSMVALAGAIALSNASAHGPGRAFTRLRRCLDLSAHFRLWSRSGIRRGVVCVAGMVALRCSGADAAAVMLGLASVLRGASRTARNIHWCWRPCFGPSRTVDQRQRCRPAVVRRFLGGLSRCAHRSLVVRPAAYRSADVGSERCDCGDRRTALYVAFSLSVARKVDWGTDTGRVRGVSTCNTGACRKRRDSCNESDLARRAHAAHARPCCCRGQKPQELGHRDTGSRHGRCPRAEAEFVRSDWGPLHGMPIGVKDLCYTRASHCGRHENFSDSFRL